MTGDPVKPRCGAKTRRTGEPCRKFPIKGKRRCRLHGCAPGAGGQPGNKNGWRHGMRSGETVTRRKRINALLREVGMTLADLAGD